MNDYINYWTLGHRGDLTSNPLWEDFVIYVHTQAQRKLRHPDCDMDSSLEVERESTLSLMYRSSLMQVEKFLGASYLDKEGDHYLAFSEELNTFFATIRTEGDFVGVYQTVEEREMFNFRLKLLVDPYIRRGRIEALKIMNQKRKYQKELERAKSHAYKVLYSTEGSNVASQVRIGSTAYDWNRVSA